MGISSRGGKEDSSVDVSLGSRDSRRMNIRRIGLSGIESRYPPARGAFGSFLVADCQLDIQSSLAERTSTGQSVHFISPRSGCCIVSSCLTHPFQPGGKHTRGLGKEVDQGHLLLLLLRCYLMSVIFKVRRVKATQVGWVE